MFLKRLIINNLNLIDNLVIPICNYFCSPRNSADMKKCLKCAKISTWTNLRQMFGNVFLVRVRLYCHKTQQTRTNFLSEENKKKLLMVPRLRALLCFFTLHKCRIEKITIDIKFDMLEYLELSRYLFIFKNNNSIFYS